MQQKTPTDQIAARFSKDIFFKNWLEREAPLRFQVSADELILKILNEEDKKTASLLMNDFGVVEKQRVEAMITNIINTKEWAPQFYAANKDTIDKLAIKGNDPSAIFKAYQNFLDSQPENILREHATVPESVLTAPVRPVKVFDPSTQPSAGPR